MSAEEANGIGPLSNLDTGRWSALHWMFTDSPQKPFRAWKSYVLPCVISVAALWVFPLIVAIGTDTVLLADRQANPGSFGFLDDVNFAFTLFITVPLVLCFMTAERTSFPGRLSKTLSSGAVLPREEWMRGGALPVWSRRFGFANVTGYMVGAIVGVLLSIMVYGALTDSEYGGWQSFKPDDWQEGEPLQLRGAGWLFLLWPWPVLYLVVTLYGVRAVCTVLFLRSMVQHSTVKMNPFHSDRCGGLAPIGQIGIRNQYLLAVAGVNIAVAVITLKIFGTKISPQMALLIAVAGVVYLVLGPFAFLAPLLPFRRVMREQKESFQKTIHNKLGQEYRQIVTRLPEEDIPTEAYKSLDTLRELKQIADQAPVWPFDLQTRRKFLSAYAVPVFTFVLALIVPIILRKLDLQ
ncbi:MAG: hypothetical protein WBE26_15380 [Phycisphaerae bacterium]